MIPSYIRAVVFDAVGTVIVPDPSPFAVYAEAASRQGFTIPRETVRERFLAAFHREEERDRAAGLATNEPREYERWRNIVRETLADTPDPEACFQHLYAHFACPDAWRVNPDAERVFANLASRGVALGLASNFDQRLLGIVEAFSLLAPLRDRVVISSQIGHRKPAPPFFEEVVRLTGCDRRQILFVGDDLTNDYEGARAAGLSAVLLDEQGQHRSVPNRIRSLSELIAFP